MVKLNRILILLTFVFSVSLSVTAQNWVLPDKLSRSIKEGEAGKASEIASEIVFSAENPAIAARSNVIVSILLFLEADPEASSRAGSVKDFYMDTQNRDEKNAVILFSFLSGKISEEKMLESIKNESLDWQATAQIARYVKILNDSGVVPSKLNSCVKSYMAHSEKLESSSWGSVWKVRLIRWHNALQDKLDKGDGLEKLIRQVKADTISGPLKDHIASLEEIIKLLLEEKKNKASRVISESLSRIENKNLEANKAYISITDFLLGKNKSMKSVYKAANPVPELFILAGVSIFTHDLSEASDGKINKNSLIMHLKNYKNNIDNTENKGVLKWKSSVEKWLKWCNDDFPLESGQEPLLERHSKALEKLNREKRERKIALISYEKLKSSKNIKAISLDDFKKVRAVFKERPRPDNMNFASPEIQNYLNSLPFEIQQGEWARIRYMKTFTRQMAGILNFSQYSGRINIGSKSLRAKVIEADSDSLTLKVGSRPKKYKWSDIKSEQYIMFIEDYIKNFIGGKVKGKDNIFTSKSDMENAVYEKYRILALFCDWYGLYPEALKYGIKAEGYKSHDSGSIRQLLLE